GALGTNGRGGTIILDANSFSQGNAGPPAPIILNVTGKGNGGGGQIVITVEDGGLVNIGTQPGNFELIARGGPTGGGGGQVHFINLTGGMTFLETAGSNPTGILVSPQVNNQDGGFIEINSGSLNWTTQLASPLLLSANATGTGQAGGV